jgi:predicted cupin superfamily sugar epimerase
MAKTRDAENKAPIGRRKFLETASLAGAAMLSARVAKAEEPTPTIPPMPDPETGAEPIFLPDAPTGPLVNPGKPMPSDVTADQIRKVLKLEPNQTCGYVRETYKSALSIAPGGLPAPFETGRPVGTALFFLVTPEAPVKLHRIMNDQLYHYYQGDPIEVLLLYESGTSELVVVGPNVVGGELVQLFIPGGTFHTARITGHRCWFLGGSTEWPGVDPTRDVELGDAEKLAAKFPEAAADIRDFPTPQEPPPPPKPEPEPAKCPEPAEAAPPKTQAEPDKP